MSRRFDSLRARLTLAFAFISLVTLFLAGSAFVFILRDHQMRRETERVAALAGPLSNHVRSLEQLGASSEEIVGYLERQAAELDLRLVLADGRGRVFADTEAALVGRQLQVQNQIRFGPGRRVRQANVQTPEGEVSFMLAPAVGAGGSQSASINPPAPGASVGERFLGRPSAYLVGLGVPPHSLATTWLELLPRLSVAALAALLLSVAVAWPLASSIAGPLTSVTRAAEDIAHGRLDRQIPAGGRDEVGRLTMAFNRMAREVSASHRTLRDFLANVSHDLRTPLTSIQGFSQALVDGTLARKAEVVDAGRVINQEAARMSLLVDDLLYLSKMESGQASLETRKVPFAPLIADRIEAASRRAVEAAVELRWAPDAAPTVVGDPDKLERVIDNLLDNALNHTPPGGVVSVRLRQGSAPLPAVQLSVHNTGSTIAEEDLPRVFERFYQADRARAAGSSGLGLAISREIVLAHGGYCWVESSLDSGTEFLVQLPGVPASESRQDAVEERAPAASTRIGRPSPSEG